MAGRLLTRQVTLAPAVALIVGQVQPTAGGAWRRGHRGGVPVYHIVCRARPVGAR
jgi:hypothetical protein